MSLQPMLSKAWSGASLMGAVNAVQVHADQLATANLSEADMATELKVPRLDNLNTQRSGTVGFRISPKGNQPCLESKQLTCQFHGLCF